MVLALVLAGIAVTGAMAQDDACADIDGATSVYNKFIENYNKKPPAVADKQSAIDAGKQFLEKWGACESWKEQVAFVRPWIKKLGTQIDEIKLNEQYKAFDTAMQAKNWDGVFAAGKQINEMVPDKSLDQMINMGMIGLVETFNKNFKYNDESLKWARIAIDRMNAGSPSVNGKYGVFQFAFGNKENAISELSYGVGYMLFYGKGDKKNGVAQLYKVTQIPGSKKDYAPVYATIGEFYLNEAAPIGKDIASKIEAIKQAPTDEEKLKIDAELKPQIALFKGYAERAMDAFGRAWSLAKSDTPAGQKYKDGLYQQIQDLYKTRFEDKQDGLNTWISSAVARPLPDPNTTVQPVVDADTTTDTTTTTTTVAKPAATTKVSTTGTEAVKVKKTN